MAPKKRSPATEGDGKATAKKKKSLDSKFGGMTEEEVMARFLPDHLKANLDVIFIGINPGLYSAYTGHHYSNASNHFWPCLFESGMIPQKMSAKDDVKCLDYGIGFTNIVPRTTRSSNDLTRKEIKEWSTVMLERMAELRPLVLCFNGKGIYEIYLGRKCAVGVQECLPGTDTVVYVMPSTSGRAASHPRRVDKLVFFHELNKVIEQCKKARAQSGTQHVDDTPLPQTTPTALPQTTPTLLPQTTPTALPQTTPTALPQTTSLPQTMPIFLPQTTPTFLPQTTPTALPQTTSLPQTMPIFLPQTTPTLLPQTTPTALPQTTPIILPQTMPTSLPQTMPIFLPQTTPIFLPHTAPMFLPQTTPTALPHQSHFPPAD